LQRHAADWLRRDGFTAEDDFLHAEVNARTVSDAEEYYRSMFTDPHGSWNLRDRHMADTLDRLIAHLATHGDGGGVVVWAHNSHVGDSRATEMSTRGEFTLGRFARERHGADVVLVGMTTHNGTVTAASDWGLPGMRRHIRPAVEGSVEDLFHSTGLPSFLLIPELDSDLHRRLGERRLERAIGVVYRPRTERESHYRWSHIADEFDAIVHIDETNALKPLEATAEWRPGEPPETFPSAL
jgi:erythromycin esterase-like protein